MIELITTSVFVLSSIYGGATTDADVISITTVQSTSSKIEAQTTTSIPTKKEIEKKAKIYFKDDPILVDIARCESSFTHLKDNGDILRGKINKNDLGLMQINEYYHADRARKLGLDLKILEGNMAYAKYLYDREGSRPWISSSKCWKQATNLKLMDQIAVNK
ncbi:MAG: hypothetical protein ABIF22_01350 [bacterium]